MKKRKLKTETIKKRIFVSVMIFLMPVAANVKHFFTPVVANLPYHPHSGAKIIFGASAPCSFPPSTECHNFKVRRKPGDFKKKTPYNSHEYIA